jgi:threonine dehydrogenase-like Zn-dependent dehydrogenase
VAAVIAMNRSGRIWFFINGVPLGNAVWVQLAKLISHLEEGGTSFVLDPNPIHYKELKIVGTYASLLDDYRAAAELITSRKILPSKLDTHIFDFDQFPETLSITEDPKALRALVRL